MSDGFELLCQHEGNLSQQNTSECVVNPPNCNYRHKYSRHRARHAFHHILHLSHRINLLTSFPLTRQVACFGHTEEASSGVECLLSEEEVFLGECLTPHENVFIDVLSVGTSVRNRFSLLFEGLVFAEEHADHGEDEGDVDDGEEDPPHYSLIQQ